MSGGAYAAACQAAKSRVLGAAEACFSSTSGELLLNGHRTVELLDKRLADLDVAPLAVALAEAKQFVKIDVSYNELGAGAAESLAQLIKVDSTITALDLSENNFTSESMEVLCTALKANTTIAQLNLSGNRIGGTGGMAIAEMLQMNTALTHVMLSNCGLTTESLVALATVLRDNGRLIKLDVSRPLARTIMDEPASHFARMLKVNTALQELDLSKAGLRDLGLRLVAEELSRAGASSALTTLRMRGNKVELSDADCVLGLSMLLGSDTCRLRTLDLGGNQLQDGGALKLSEIVSENVSLHELDISSNALMSRGLCAIARAAKVNPKLHSIRLFGNVFDSAACLAWSEMAGSRLLDFKVQLVDGAYHCVDDR